MTAVSIRLHAFAHWRNDKERETESAQDEETNSDGEQRLS